MFHPDRNTLFVRLALVIAVVISATAVCSRKRWFMTGAVPAKCLSRIQRLRAGKPSRSNY